MISNTVKKAASPLGFLRQPLAAAVMMAIVSPAFAANGFSDTGTTAEFVQLSADGSTLLSQTVGLSTVHSYVWTAAGGATQFLPQETGDVYASGVSADGSMIAVDLDNGTSYSGYRWNAASGLVAMGAVPGATSTGVGGISADGSILFGGGRFVVGGLNVVHAVRWVNGVGQDLGAVTTGGIHDSSATAMSADGSTVVGDSSLAGNNASPIHAFRWSNGVMADLGVIPGATNTYGDTVSGDGSVVAGEATGDNDFNRVYRWTASTGMVDIGALAGGTIGLNAISTDGTTLVGEAEILTPGGIAHAYRWTQATGVQDLGTLLAGASSEAVAVNANGRVVVGNSNTVTGLPASEFVSLPTQAFRWTQVTGMQSVETWLSSNGVAVANNAPHTTTAEAVSADGSVVSGYLDNGHLYVARVANVNSGSTSNGGGSLSSGGSVSTNSGMIDTTQYSQSLGAAAVAPNVALNNADMVINGAHGSPMRNLVPEGRYSVWGGGDAGRADSNGRDADLGSMEVGVGTNVGHGVQFNFALGRGFSQNDTQLGGETTARSTYVVPEAVIKILDTPLYATLSGYYAKGDVNIDRGYLNAGSQVQSHGSTDSETWGGRVRLDWLNAFSLAHADFTPYASVGYVQTRLDSYTENGGGFPSQWDARTDRSTTSRFGLDGVYALNAKVNLLGRIEADHRFEDQGSNARGNVVGLYGFDLDGQHYKQDWARASIGAEAQIGEGVGSLVVNGTTEGQDPDYWVALSYKWLL